jgi:Spy/CpxP family protein refolding chaperone
MNKSTLSVLTVVFSLAAANALWAQEPPGSDNMKSPRTKPNGERGLTTGARSGGEVGGRSTREQLFAKILENPKIAEEIGLTPQQVEGIKSKMQAIEKDQTELQSELEKSGTEQARLLSRENVDEDALMKSVERTGDIRTKLAKLHVSRLLMLKKSLTSEQVEKLKALVQERKKTREERAEEMGRDRPKGLKNDQGGIEGGDQEQLKRKDLTPEQREKLKAMIKERRKMMKEERQKIPGDESTGTEGNWEQQKQKDWSKQTDKTTPPSSSTGGLGE